MSKEAAMAIATGVKNETTTTNISSESEKGNGTSSISATSTSNDDQRIQSIIKKEVKFVKEVEQFKKEKADMQAKIDRANALLERDKQFDELRKTDNIAALKMLGYSDNEIFNSLAASAPKERTPEQVAREAALEEIKKADEKRSEEAKESEVKKNDSIIKSFKTQIAQTIEKNPDKYEYCKFNGDFAEELIYATVEQVLKEDKKLITTDEAAQLVENFYEERDKAMSTLKKRKPATPVKEPSQDEKVTEVKTQASQAGKPKTLTNNVRPTAAAIESKKESAEQKRSRLERALREGIHPSQLR
jgi:hypothetical protein